MAYQKVFKRYELKYIVTKEQKEKLLMAMEPYMEPDRYGKSTVRNIYFDTDDYILARHSIAKPDFKEKLRIRSYSQAAPESEVFVELKRKYDHVVYKRRIAMTESEAMGWMKGINAGARNDLSASDNSMQLHSEIDYFMKYYRDLRPAAFLSYDRQAYRMRDPGKSGHSTAADFRVTFDENILFRDTDLSLTEEVGGEAVLDRDKILMELKCSGGIPMWMAKVLSEEHIYKTSFSKYGTAYSRYILPELAQEKPPQQDKNSTDDRRKSSWKLYSQGSTIHRQHQSA